MKIFEAFASAGAVSDATMLTVRNYFEWQLQRRSVEFIPSADDDVDLRTYLFYLQSKGADQADLAAQVAALQAFYGWVHAQGLIPQNPFDVYHFSPPFPNRNQSSSRQRVQPDDPNEREVQRLRALSQITSQLNSSVDIHTALESTLKTLLQVMNLQTGWVSMRTDSPLSVFPAGTPVSHGFELATAHGLPPGLEREDRRYLRQAPACHCQQLLMEGRLTSAVNIVECTRLRDSMLAAGNNQGLHYHASVPLISQGEPVGIIQAATTDWQLLTHADLQFLSAVSEQLVVGLERAHIYEVSEARRTLLENELEIAREVQAGLMPGQMPDIAGFGLAGIWRPARQIAGDFYDIFPLAEGRWGVMIGDVAGEGAAAALYMAMVHSLILSGALRDRSPAKVLTEVNQTILMQSAGGIFVTAFLAVIDPQKGSLCYANAGHNPPVLRRASGETEFLTRTGAVLGVFEGLQVGEKTVTLEPGDAVVMYTDGVTEALRPDDGEYGFNRLTSAIATAPVEAEAFLNHLNADLNAFTEGAAQQDDVTMLILARKEVPKPVKHQR